MFSAQVAAAALAADRPIRLLVVTGGHPFEPQFFQLFEGKSWLKAEHRQHEWKVSSTAFAKPFARDFDAIVLYDFLPVITEAEKANLLEVFEAGTGVIHLHHGLIKYPNWAGWEEIAGCRARQKADGNFPAVTWKHDVEIPVHIADRDHPVTNGLTDFRLVDEVYGAILLREGIHPLLTTDHPLSMPVLAWTKDYGKSRMVSIQPGHGPSGWTNPNYQRLIDNSIRWVARR